MGEVEIGDVGYIDDGAFVRVFNVRSDVPPVAFWPKTFSSTEPLPEEALLVDRRPQPLGPGCYHSHGVEEIHLEGSASAYV